MEGEALSLSAPSLKQVLTESPQLARLIIGYSHALFAQLVRIVDLAGFAQRSCSCYEGVKVEYDRAYRSA